ncbi:hypothetical protein PUNSTDRAFT_61430, partial [Punctularia strigosozonata HHB-11173 SS5]|uniref:uncharacterized protein n=1 Tax=Punctularia strigosozonata (strain HHB-11173) TaxID=741275 RepID=UPI000441667D
MTAPSKPIELCQCGQRQGELRCCECIGDDLLCSSCIADVHRSLPLHSIEKWTGTHFERATLRDCSLVVQLGHSPGRMCVSPIPAHSKFTVVHTNGSHLVKVLYCGCSGVEPHIQLLRTRWFPASWQCPRTAITFDYLNTFHLLSLTAKTTLWDYYQATEFKADNARLQPVKHHRNAVSFAVRVWRHLKSLLRAGSGYIPEGAQSTPRGALSIKCPSCPHPDINLPADWKSLPPDERWKYALFIAVDGNFKLKLKDRGVKDVQFGSGWSYFVEPEAYHKHISEATQLDEIPPCGSQHNAVQQALTRGNSKTIATGIAGVVCSRHVMMLPNGIGELQKGERYANIDFVVASALSVVGKDIEVLNMSYDIMCIYSVNMRSRFALLPAIILIPWFLVIRAFIPKFHLYAHGASCQTRYSYNVNCGVGRTHGESVEQNWAYLALAATSIREMGLGHWRLVLEDMVGGANFRKKVNLGHHFTTHLPDAVQLRDAYQEIANNFTATFPSEIVAKWRSMVVAWQNDHSQPDPFAEPETGNNLDSLREELLREEATSPSTLLQGSVTPSEFIRMGFVLEDKQRAIRLRATSSTQRTAAQRVSLQQMRVSLKHSLANYFKVQAVYMPDCPGVRDTLDGVADGPISDEHLGGAHPENARLLLPSCVKAEVRADICRFDVAKVEYRMRIAQAEDALTDIRRLRRVYQGLRSRLRKNVFGVGQSTNTRSQAIIKGFSDKLENQKHKYRAAFNALKALDPTGNWRTYLLELNDADVSGPGQDEDDEIEQRVRLQQKYAKSWIWTTPVPNGLPLSSSDISDLELNEQIRTEWAKTDARAARWAEEVVLLQEEMRRTLHWFEWQASWWKMQPARRGDAPPHLRAGLHAYAHKQAAILRKQARNFAGQWIPIMLEHGFSAEWIGRY